jgi:pantothenate kinase-related protein Tda10
LANGTTTKSVQERYAAVLAAKADRDQAEVAMKAVLADKDKRLLDAVKELVADQDNATIRAISGPDGKKVGFLKYNGQVKDFPIIEVTS